MGRVISGFLDLKCKIDFHVKPKDLISYTSLVKAIEDYRNYGDPYFRDKNDSKMKNSQKISKHFGLFLTFLVMSA
jgi:hypothetical protein